MTKTILPLSLHSPLSNLGARVLPVLPTTPCGPFLCNQQGCSIWDSDRWEGRRCPTCLSQIMLCTCIQNPPLFHKQSTQKPKPLELLRAVCSSLPLPLILGRLPAPPQCFVFLVFFFRFQSRHCLLICIMHTIPQRGGGGGKDRERRISKKLIPRMSFVLSRTPCLLSFEQWFLATPRAVVISITVSLSFSVFWGKD